MFHRLLLFLFLFESFFVSGQILSGTVIDADTKEPVPFAHVILGKSGTITNIEGSFVLNRESKDSILHVTFVGYIPTKINLNRYPISRIELSPSTINLDAVTVIAGPEVVDEFRNHIIVNYEMEAQQMTSYYKEKLKGNDSLYYLAEGILEIYEPSNVSDDGIQVNPVRTRRKIMKNIDPNQITMISGSAFDMVRSSVWRSNSFLSPQNIVNYEFEYAGIMPYKEREVYRLRFYPKTPKGYVSGEMYIEEGSYAIIKLIYEPQINQSLLWDWIKWTEEFDYFDGTYQLTCVTFNGTWKEQGIDFAYEALLISTDFIKSKPAHILNPTITKKDIFLEKAADDFSESFWDGYNFMKLTDTEVSPISKQ